MKEKILKTHFPQVLVIFTKKIRLFPFTMTVNLRLLQCPVGGAAWCFSV